MRRFSVLTAAALIFISGAMPSGASRGPLLSEHELAVLKACEGVVRVFEGSSERIWPGFDLSRRPFLVYIPGRWALLVNPPDGAGDFGPLPADWPPLRIKAGYLAGSYRDLVGQLAFDLDVGGAQTVALGLLDGQFGTFGPEAPSVLGFIVHESFHQFQSETFGDIPWEREERYPILDADNTALAALEMRILEEAITGSLAGRRDRAEALLPMFVAVRTARWGQAPPFVARYEQGQEVREGTAAYVEKKCLALGHGLDFGSALEGRTTPLKKDLDAVPIAELFRKDFEGRTTDRAVSPDDMIRNRIYPLGSALGFLADLWGPGWKQQLVRNVGTFTFHEYFRDKLALKAEDRAPLLEAAKAKYDYPAIRRGAAALISGYRAGFEKDLAGFEGQAGTRVEVRLHYRTITRSRSSQGRNWVVDDGAKSLATKARVYSLKTDGLTLQVNEAAIYEENDWDAKDKRVAFFAPAAPGVVLDGAPRPAGPGPAVLRFREIGLTAPNLQFSARLPGVLKLEKDRIVIELAASGERP